MFNILLLNNHRLCRDALCEYIAFSNENYNVSGISSIDDLYSAVKKNKLDLLIVDIDENFSQEHWQIYNGKKMFLLNDEYYSSEFRRQENVRGVLKKECTGKQLKECIEIILEGGEYFENLWASTSEHTQSYKSNILKTLTKREKEILKYLAHGDSNKEISRALYIEITTVKLHVRSICKKLNVSNRTKAALFLKESSWN